MADTSIVGQSELEAIASASGFAVWELQQVVSDGNFAFLIEEFRAGNLGQVVNPEQALEAPSVAGQAVQAAIEKGDDITAALGSGLRAIAAPLKELGLQAVVLAVAVGIIALIILRR